MRCSKFFRITALAFLRLSTHPKVLSRPLSVNESWEIYQRYRNECQIGFIEDSQDIDPDFIEMSRVTDVAHHLWTDCYLASLARFRRCRMVSFDTDFHRFPELDFLHLAV